MIFVAFYVSAELVSVWLCDIVTVNVDFLLQKVQIMQISPSFSEQTILQVTRLDACDMETCF